MNLACSLTRVQAWQVVGALPGAAPRLNERIASIPALHHLNIDKHIQRAFRFDRHFNSVDFDDSREGHCRGHCESHTLQRHSKRCKTTKKKGTNVSPAAISALILTAIEKGAKVAVGAGVIFALDRSLLALSRAAGVKIPTAPIGMMIVFMGLLVMNVTSPARTSQLVTFFSGARKFYRSLGHCQFAARSSSNDNMLTLLCMPLSSPAIILFSNTLSC